MATSTPWGAAQSVTNVARGIRWVCTADHGGVLVSPTFNALIPEYMRDESGAYEEDCEWVIPAIVFEVEWRAWADSTDWTTGDFQMESAWKILKNWNPDAFQQLTGRKLAVGESLAHDERLLEAQLRDAFVVLSAWGDWKEGIPKGMVGVLAQRRADGEKIFGWVPKEEYQKRNLIVGKAGAFVVDPAKHQIVPIPTYAL